MSPPLVRLSDVTLGYREPLLGPLQMEIGRGEFWGVIGPNGGGKTTLVRTILGLLPPLAGTVTRPPVPARVSYTPQRHTLDSSYPLSAFDVALMGRTTHRPLGRRPQGNDRKRVHEELERLGLSALASQPFRSLSGGQQQRVLLTRALAADPDLIVLDEPAEGMDLLGARDILRLLRQVNTDARMTVIMVSHKLDDVLQSVDRLCLINHAQHLFETGPTETLATAGHLSNLYGRPLETYSWAGELHVRVPGAS